MWARPAQAGTERGANVAMLAQHDHGQARFAGFCERRHARTSWSWFEMRTWRKGPKPRCSTGKGAKVPHTMSCLITRTPPNTHGHTHTKKKNRRCKHNPRTGRRVLAYLKRIPFRERQLVCCRRLEVVERWRGRARTLIGQSGWWCEQEITLAFVSTRGRDGECSAQAHQPRTFSLHDSPGCVP